METEVEKQLIFHDQKLHIHRTTEKSQNAHKMIREIQDARTEMLE